MNDQLKPTRRYFTSAARAAAAEAIRRKKENAIPKDRPSVFVVRVPPTNKDYGWEIRRYGNIVLRRSAETFATLSEARIAGDIALATGLTHNADCC